MDNIFGVGLPELILVMIIAGIVLGPERIVVAARWLGRTTSQLQGVSRSFFRQLNAEIDGIDQSGELKETIEELNQLRRQVDDLRAEFVGVATGLSAETRQTLKQVEEDTIGSIAPPSLLKNTNPSAAVETYRPPSLLEPMPESNGNGTVVTSPPTSLPKRVDTSDDPE